LDLGDTLGFNYFVGLLIKMGLSYFEYQIVSTSSGEIVPLSLEQSELDDTARGIFYTIHTNYFSLTQLVCPIAQGRVCALEEVIVCAFLESFVTRDLEVEIHWKEQFTLPFLTTLD
jgi:hypothetical protein